jgi:hypothetical protein
MSNELTEVDAKAIKAESDKYLEQQNHNEDNIYAAFQIGAEWGIKHARTNDDPGPEWVASNILEGAAKRIAELEAANAKLMDEFDKNITTLGQYLFYPHPKELMAEIERLKSSPVSVDINREWIDRNKQMPEPHVQVLINIQYGMGNRSYALSYCTKRFPDTFDHFSDGIITHWMPLPEHPALSKASPPKQNEK